MTRLAGSSKLLRAMNASAALAHLLEVGELTRADLRRLTQLSTPTISEVLRRLTDAGLVSVVGYHSGRPGPNAEIYAVDPDAAYAAALSVRDIGASGGPSVVAALCDLTGEVRARIERQVDFLRADPRTALVEAIADLHAEAGVPADKIHHVQLAVAGSYDARAETIRHVDVPGFARPGLVPETAAALGTRVGVDNDVNLAAVAERRRGVAQEADGFALLWLGQEGLGLAIDIGGTLIRGARGGAGEIGYMPLYAPGSIHRKVDLQDLVGGAAIMALGQDHGIPGRTPLDIVTTAATTPGRSGEFITQLADRIAVGLAAVIAVLDPSLVVLAGPIARAGGETLLAAVRDAVHRAAPLESTIAVTTIADDAVLLGALDAGLTAVRESLIAAIRDNQT
ncbi:ROK family transcriptional regulator [Couchioplanes caeruleus]|uniref:XylR family transcriptional regulator n=2 Tax=Couchioplanes caeruleus TaxID=56438 RepID=A0A1K0GUF0_9ACTN|nr:ROK family transcriptional regulator [Couchioplanes caeruleus]OJF16134.1 XylR family transcriptional regulator [Couchioplanes caeruleus subsp. caeruleus]ROP31581.1 putative NBD/HSP70 family sugar kinase [Couchioplanes caeruleus]